MNPPIVSDKLITESGKIINFIFPHNNLSKTFYLNNEKTIKQDVQDKTEIQKELGKSIIRLESQQEFICMDNKSSLDEYMFKILDDIRRQK